jgi:hypothetical protein
MSLDDGGPVDILSMIDLWRERAAEVSAQAAQFQDGSISNIVLLGIAESYLRLARREESLLPPPAGSALRPSSGQAGA